jgi:hypothetical protein
VGYERMLRGLEPQHDADRAGAHLCSDFEPIGARLVHRG